MRCPSVQLKKFLNSTDKEIENNQSQMVKRLMNSINIGTKVKTLTENIINKSAKNNKSSQTKIVSERSPRLSQNTHRNENLNFNKVNPITISKNSYLYIYNNRQLMTGNNLFSNRDRSVDRSVIQGNNIKSKNLNNDKGIYSYDYINSFQKFIQKLNKKKTEPTQVILRSKQENNKEDQKSTRKDSKELMLMNKYSPKDVIKNLKSEIQKKHKSNPLEKSTERFYQDIITDQNNKSSKSIKKIKAFIDQAYKKYVDTGS